MSIQAMTNFSLFCLGLAFLVLCGSLIFLKKACKRASSVQAQAEELLHRNEARSKALDAAEQAERSKFLRETTRLPETSNVVSLRGARG